MSNSSKVILNGNITIDDINVILAGIYISTKTLAGSTASVNQTVTLLSGKETKIYGTAGTDTVNVVIAGKEGTVYLDTGGGGDKVTLTTQYGGVGAGSSFGNKVTVDTGAGADSVTLTHQTGVLQAVIRTGDGSDTVAMTCGANTARSYEKGGAAVSSSLLLDLGAGNDAVTINASLAAAFEKMSFYGGSGLDSLGGLDTETALHTALNGNATLSEALADSGFDSLTMVGDLSEKQQISGDIRSPLSGIIAQAAENYFGYVKLLAAAAKAYDPEEAGAPAEHPDVMQISLTGFNALNDTLTNKPTVELESLAFASGKAPSSFTNYTYTGSLKDSSGSLNPLTADWSRYTVVLTNLTLGKKKEGVRLGNINIPTVNLTVLGDHIEVGGTVAERRGVWSSMHQQQGSHGWQSGN